MHNRYYDDSESVRWSAFLAGALIGGGLALLLAPHSGQELRGRLRDYASRATDDLLEKGYEAFDSAVEQGKDYYRKAEEVVRDTGQSVREFTEEAGKQGQRAMKDAGREAQRVAKHK